MSSRFPKIEYRDIIIGTGADGLSGYTRLEGYTLVGMIMPSAWTAANITFESCATYDGTYLDVYDQDGTEVTVTVGSASDYIILEPAKFAGLGWTKLRSGTTGTPVQQAAARTVTLVLRPVA
jgi:hypothetical protein